LVDGAQRTVVRSYQLDLCSETELRIQVKELLFNNAYLSQVVDDMKSWFPRMEVLDLIYHQFFFTANSFGRQPTTSQDFQPLAPQTLALVAAAIHCALSEYAGGKKATVMFSQDVYRGTFCPSPMINFTPEATALINHTLVGRFKPPPTTMWRNSTRIGAPQSPSALLSLDSLSSISFRSQFLLFWRSSGGIGAPQSPSALLSLDSLSSISFRSQFLLFRRSSAGIGTP